MSKLGRGLGALIPGSENLEGLAGVLESWDNPENTNKDEYVNKQEIDITKITPCRTQPRRDASAADIDVLADNIKEYGIIQPLLLRKTAADEYEIIAGERRFRAAMKAGLKTVPAVIREAEASEVMELALIENLQRVDLNPIDEALGYKTLIEQYNLTQEKVAEKVGKARASITNSLRILNLPSEVVEQVKEGKISLGHAKVLLSAPQEKIAEFAEKVISKGLSVRATESLIKNSSSDKKDNNFVISDNMKIYLSDIADGISQKLGTKVRIMPSAKKSKIEIEYYSSKDLERILEVLS
ncbi:ParB/RepB/Spo0J family partition protein [Treponema sp. R6D11]